MWRPHPAFPILFLLTLSAALVLRARPPQTCGTPTNTQTKIYDNCGSVEYDLSATNGYDIYDAGYYIAQGACLGHTFDCNCVPNPTEKQGTFTFHYYGDRLDGWTVWWSATYYNLVGQFMCTSGACAGSGTTLMIAQVPGPAYVGRGSLGACPQ